MSEVGEAEEQPKRVKDPRENRLGWSKERGGLSKAQWTENELYQKELDKPNSPVDKPRADEPILKRTPNAKSVPSVPFAPLKLPK